MRLRTTTALAALVAAGLTPLTLASSPASAAPAKYGDDFNGDGFRDLAVTAPYATAASADQAGAVVVSYGSANGVTSARSTVISQSSAGVPGASEAGDLFGSAVAAGDFNSDGYGDLAVGASGEDTSAGVGTGEDTGAVTVLWGSSAGLSGGTALELPPVNYPHGYGVSLASGDFNGDGRDDLAMGSMSYHGIFIYDGGTEKGSSTLGGRHGFAATSLSKNSYIESLAAGDIDHDGTDDLVVGGNNNETEDFFKQSVYLAPGTTRHTYAGDVSHGDTAAVGDVDGDGYADIVTGHKSEPRSIFAGTTLGGNVTLTYGSASGPDTSRPPVTITQDTAGVPGASEANDQFGASVTLGDITGDKYADLVVGAPQESVGAAEYTGSVTVIPGGPSGLSTATSYTYHQDTAGVPGAAERNDNFGSSVALRDTNADGRADLAVGASGENNYTGAMWSLKANSSRLTTTGATSFSATTVGLRTTGVANEPEFGTGIG
ncbi:FG-GAP-like repeat-containing protein [Streptomyces sp. NPDC046821]|uniref:FG-GAP-like repeat-containing protein n=1 Tax=Streptomyces sp. NPDC046821 TaxID=3154702 RepID=UPI0033E2FE08